MSEEREEQATIRLPLDSSASGTWPIAKGWPDSGVAQLANGLWYRIAHVGDGQYVIVSGAFGTYQRAALNGEET